MNAALVTSALLMGLAGGPHCAAMCGAAHGAIARQGGHARFTETMLALQAGRLVGYAVAGALVAASVAGLGALQEAAPIVRPLWTMAHVGAVALGVWLACKARAPAWLSVAGQPAQRLLNAEPIRVFRKLPAGARAGLAGVCWAVVPCGLLQSALLVAALASGPVQGAAVMAAFAVASAVSLWLGPRLWLLLRWRGGPDRAASLSVRVAGVLLAGSSLFALSHGLGSAIAQFCRSVVG